MAKCKLLTISFLFVLLFAALANALNMSTAFAAAPVLSSIILSDIDSGSTYVTNDVIINVAINASGSPAQMMLSIYNDFHDTTWIAYVNPATYTFVSTYNGPRTVYCKLRNISLEESNIAQDTIIMDVFPPSVSTTYCRVVDNSHIDIAFTELMGNAENPACYSINNGVDVLSVQYQGPSSNFRYRLTTTPQQGGIVHTVTVSTSTTDVAGNLINPSARTYSYIAAAPTGDTTPPVANAGEDKITTVGATVMFDGSLSTDNVGITRYVWNFGDGSSTVEGVSASHAYAAPNIYTVTLTVYDAAGNSGADTAKVTVTQSGGAVYLEVGGPSPDYGTITEAMANIAEGGTVYVYAGVYPEIVHLKDNVTLKGENSEAVIIKGEIIAEEVTATIEGLTVLYNVGTMLAFTNAHYSDLNLIVDAGITAINSPVTVKRCIIGPELDFINVEGGYDPPLEYYGNGIQIWNMCGTDIIEPQVENNLIQNTSCGIYYFSQAFGGAINGHIKNNTFYHNKNGVVLRMHKENPHICNNIFDSSLEIAVFLIYKDDILFDQRKANINNNLFNQNGKNLFIDSIGLVENIIGWQFNIQGDPLFADAESGDFHLLAGSPCLGAGEGEEDIGAFGEAVVSELFIEITSPQNGIIIYPKP